MRKLLTWTAVTLGIAALARRLKRRRTAAVPAAPTTAPPSSADPADELRRTLAAARSPEQTAADEQLPDGTVAERRADVHGDGKAALEEMRSRRAGD
jgi:hypothetical protein